MNVRTIVFTICLTALAPGTTAAEQQPGTQTPPPRVEGPATAPAPQVATTIQPPRRTGQPINIRVDVTITDQRGGNAPALKKTVTVVTADRLSGYIRSTANYLNLPPVPLNVDTEPELLSDGKIRLAVNLQYDLPADRSAQTVEAATAGPLRSTQIRENLAMILESGKPLVVAQSADPVGDRQVTIEVKATVLR